MSDQNMIDEDELLQLFARRRPDPDRIAAGIAQRLAGDEADKSGGGDSAPSQAAAWLPLPLTQGSKLWLWLSMPMLLLAGTWIALFGSGSHIRKSLRVGPQPLSGETKVPNRSALQNPGWFSSAVFGCSLAALLLAGSSNVFDVLLLASVLSMFSLAHLVRKNVALGYGDRDQMAAICVGLLDSLLILTLFFSHRGFNTADAGQWILASPLVLAAGTLAFIRYNPARCVVSIAFACYIVFWSPFSWLVPTTEHPATLQQVQAFIGAPELQANDRRLKEYRSIVLALRAAGEEVGVPKDLWQTVLKPSTADLPLDSFALSECARMDLLPEHEWRRIAATSYRKNQINRFLKQRGPLKLKQYDEYVFRLLMTRELSDEQVAALAERLMASWPTSQDWSPLIKCRLIVAGLDLIGRSDLADQKRDLVHAALVRMQQYTEFASGGFSEARGFSKRICNDVAMALIARFGMPQELDLRSLKAHLQHKILISKWTHAEARDTAYVSLAQLLQFEAQVVALPNRTFLRIMIDERMLWSMIALVLLCIYTVCITPVRLKPANGPQHGAMP